MVAFFLVRSQVTDDATWNTRMLHKSRRKENWESKKKKIEIRASRKLRKNFYFLLSDFSFSRQLSAFSFLLSTLTLALTPLPLAFLLRAPMVEN
jgi:hypothetical protein